MSLKQGVLSIISALVFPQNTRTNILKPYEPSFEKVIYKNSPVCPKVTEILVNFCFGSYGTCILNASN